MQYLILSLFSLILLVGCQNSDDVAYSPKPRMYPYVELPAAQYETVNEKSDCGFTFRKSVHARIVDREMFFSEKLPDNCWFDLKYPALDANVHFTYYPIGKKQTFDALSSESFQMVYEHSAVASGIEETPIRQNGGAGGMAFELKGPVASPYQFFLSDTTDHFLRAALYFRVQPNPDSIAPVLHYIQTDMDTLIKSLQWQ